MQWGLRKRLERSKGSAEFEGTVHLFLFNLFWGALFSISFFKVFDAGAWAENAKEGGMVHWERLKAKSTAVGYSCGCSLQ